MDREQLQLLLKQSSENDEVRNMGYWNEIWNQYVEESSAYYNRMSSKDALVSLISNKNFMERSKVSSCEQLGIWIQPGDICFIDYGLNYINEAGFQHFGLIMKIINKKAIVIPMTSNSHTYRDAIRRNGRNHLMAIGQIEGMNKPSVLFLNDMRFINTARIIDVKAHIPVGSELFQCIYERYLKMISY